MYCLHLLLCLAPRLMLMQQNKPLTYVCEVRKMNYHAPTGIRLQIKDLFHFSTQNANYHLSNAIIISKRVSVHLSLNYDVTSSIIIIYNEAFFFFFFLATHNSCCCWAISRMDSSSGDFECHNKCQWWHQEAPSKESSCAGSIVS